MIEPRAGCRRGGEGGSASELRPWLLLIHSSAFPHQQLSLTRSWTSITILSVFTVEVVSKLAVFGRQATW